MEKFYQKKVSQNSDIIFERLLMGDASTKEEIEGLFEKDRDLFAPLSYPLSYISDLNISPIEGEEEIREISFILNELKTKIKKETIISRNFLGKKIEKSVTVVDKPKWVETELRYFSKVEIRESNKKTIIKE